MVEKSCRLLLVFFYSSLVTGLAEEWAIIMTLAMLVIIPIGSIAKEVVGRPRPIIP